MKWLDKNQEKILFFTWCFIILTCLLVIFTSPVKAASSVKKLPYDYSWNYTALTENQINLILNQASKYIDTSSDNLIIFFYEPSGYVTYPTICVAVVDSVIYSNNASYENADLLMDSLSFHFSSSTISMYSPDISSVIDNGNQYYAPTGYSFFGSNAILMQVNFYPYELYRNMPLYGTVELDEKLIIGTPNNESDLGSGHATQPINDPDNIIDDGNGNPIQRPTRPTPTPFTPQPWSPPSIDTSSLETLVESLIDVVKYGFSYLGDLISGSFSNLLSNFSSWVDYIVQSFNYGFNNIVKAIQNLATDFYNNMVSLFEPLYEFFSGVATFFNNLIQLGMDGDSFSLSTFFYNLLVPDSEDFAQALIDGDIHHVVPLVSSVHTKFVNLFNSFITLTPSKVLVLPSFSWHHQTFNLSVDFSWYDDYKVYGDTIISGFLIIGYIYWFVLQLSSMFRGGNSIGHDVSKVGGQH